MGAHAGTRHGMAETDRAESALITDLATLGERFRDEQFSTELYRALAGGHLTKDGQGFAPSWSRAERLVNDLRAEQGNEPLTLAQTGGEGEVSDLVADELQGLGWRWKSRDTSQDDPAHANEPASPSTSETGERQAPVSDSSEWERTAHAEADATRAGRSDAPADSGPGNAAGGGEAGRVGGS